MSELALNSEDNEERQRHLDEGEDLLRSGAVAHNHVFFYRNAMDACLESENWGGVERYGQTLWDFTRQEPLPICDFYIARGRSLAAVSTDVVISKRPGSSPTKYNAMPVLNTAAPAIAATRPTTS